MSALLRGVTSKHDRDFCYLNCFHSYTKTISLKSIIMYVETMIIVM